MAFDPNEKDPNQQNQDNATNQPMTSSAPGAGPGTATGKATTPQSTPAQPFQNLQAYLTANAPQVQEQGAKVAGDLTGQYGAITNDINKGKADFGEQVKAGYVAPNEKLTKSAAEDPTKFVSDPNNVKAFQSLYNDQYTGPSNFESSDTYGNLNNEVQQGTGKAKTLQTTAGLQDYFKGRSPNSTQGMNLLDTVLVKGSPEASKQITDAAKQFENLNDYLGNSVTEANQGVNAAQKTAQDTAQGVRGQFTGAGGVIPGFEDQFNQRLSQARTDATAKADKTMAGLLSGGSATPQPTIQSLVDLGFSPAEAEALAGSIMSLKTDYGKSFNPNLVTRQNPDVAITPEAFASKADYDRAAALSQLTGNDLSSFLNPTNSGKAGTSPTNLLGVDKTAFQNETTNALRQNDQNALQDIFNRAIPTKVDINQYLSDPKNVASLRSKLSGADLATFDKVMTRLGYNALNGGNSNTGTGGYTTMPLNPSMGGSFIDPATGKRIS